MKRAKWLFTFTTVIVLVGLIFVLNTWPVKAVAPTSSQSGNEIAYPRGVHPGGTGVHTGEMGDVVPQTGHLAFRISTSSSTDYIYAFGGKNTPNFWRYNVASSTWEVLADAPGNVHAGGDLAMANGYIYGMGGGSTNAFWRYDPTTNTWSDSAAADVPLPPGKEVGTGGALTYDGRYIYAIVGGNDSSTDNDLWRYDPNTDTWSLLTYTPVPQSGGSDITYGDGYIYFLGGNDENDDPGIWGPPNPGYEFYRYNLATGSWERLHDLPNVEPAKEGAAIVFHSGSVLGAPSSSGTIYAWVGGDKKLYYRYDIATDTWIEDPPADSPYKVENGSDLCSDGNNAIYGFPATDTKYFQVYDTDGDSWSQLPQTPAQVHDGGALLCAFGTGTPASGTVSGRVWHDQYVSESHKVDGIQDAGEPGIAGVVVELYDSSNSLVTTVTTGSDGSYSFTGLSAGTYRVKIADSNFDAGGALDNTSAALEWYATMQDEGGDDSRDSDGDESSHDVTVSLSSGEQEEHVDFGFFRSCVSLQKTGPISMNAGDTINYHFRVENCGDVVLHGGVSVYDPLLEPDGDHEIWWNVVYPGEVYEFDRSYTTDASSCPTLTNTATAEGHPLHPRDDSNLPTVTSEDSWTVSCYTFDWGDAPETYGTSLAANGPRHILGSGLVIGSSVDAEDDGQPTADASGDDTHGGDDEDGLNACISLTRGQTGLVSVPVNNPLASDATLYGWIDFNGNGTFEAGNEYTTVSVPAGTNGPVILDFGTVPMTSTTNTFARLRLTTDTLCTGSSGTYRDEFSSVAYDNSDGSADWSAFSWQELNDDGSPSSGDITIDNGRLRFVKLDENEGIERRVDLSGVTQATLTFDWETEDLEEELAVYISSDGTNFTLLGVIKNEWSSGSKSFDISAYASANTTIRFLNTYGDWSATDDVAYVDNLQVAFSSDCTGGLAHDGEVEDYPVCIQTATGTIGDTVWNDTNGDGTQNAGEPGIDGVVLRLYRDDGDNAFEPGGDDVLVGTQTTSGGGNYDFSSLTAGTYWVDVDESTLASGYHLTTANEPLKVTLSSGQDYNDADFGYAGLGDIAGTVFYDWNENGAQDAGEDGIGGVQVCLYKDDGDGTYDVGDAQEACKNTNSDGTYVFNDYMPGTYFVVESQPPDLQDTTPNVRRVDLVVVGPSGSATDNDFGDVVKGRIGDFVWVDSDGDGVQDAGETSGIPNLPLHVTGVNVIDETIDMTVTTSITGYYTVSDLLPGTYTVTAPASFSGFVRTSTSPLTTTLTVGDMEDLSLDFGYVSPTGVELVSFQYEAMVAGVRMAWTVRLTDGSVPGFRVWRAVSGGRWKLLTPDWLDWDRISGDEASYNYEDTTVYPGTSYAYKLESEDGTFFGPWQVDVPEVDDGGETIASRRVFMPFLNR